MICISLSPTPPSPSVTSLKPYNGSNWPPQASKRSVSHEGCYVVLHRGGAPRQVPVQLIVCARTQWVGGAASVHLTLHPILPPGPSPACKLGIPPPLLLSPNDWLLAAENGWDLERIACQPSNGEREVEVKTRKRREGKKDFAENIVDLL